MINRVNKPQSIYDMMGGEEPLKSLVETFYDIVETDPAGELVRVLHLRGNSIAHTRLAQFDFLSGFLGGPRYYVEKNGHSNNRKIHEHVPIGPNEVKAWLICMEKAIDKVGFRKEVKDKMMNLFTIAAEAVRNQEL